MVANYFRNRLMIFLSVNRTCDTICDTKYDKDFNMIFQSE